MGALAHRAGGQRRHLRSYGFTFKSPTDPAPTIDGEPYAPKAADKFRIDGFFSWEEIDGDIAVRRTIFPSTSLLCLIERWEIRNTGAQYSPGASSRRPY